MLENCNNIYDEVWKAAKGPVCSSVFADDVHVSVNMGPLGITDNSVGKNNPQTF